MEAYIIKATEDTPAITLDKSTGTYSIVGRSLPEDVMTFYKPMLEWLTEFSKSPSSEMSMNIKLEYFNTASSKILLDILLKLNDIAEKSTIVIKWHYDKNDEDMLEAGEEYSELVEIPFTLLPY